MVIKSSDTTNNNNNNDNSDELPRFSWGSTRQLRCQLLNENDDDNGRRPSEIKKKMIKKAKVGSTSAPPPPPPPKVGPVAATEKRTKRNEKAAAEFRLTLMKEEIEADFIAMTGAKPPRRPIRRPKNVQFQVESSFPGLLLPKNIASHRYNVPE